MLRNFVSRLANAAAASNTAQAACCNGPSVSSLISASLSPSCSTAACARSSGNTWQTSAAGVRRGFAAERKSSSSHVFEAAEARMQKLKKVAEQQQAVQQGHEVPGPVGRVLGALGDGAMLAIAGVVGFSGYYSLAYRDTKELEKMVKETCSANSSSAGSKPPSTPPPTGSGDAAGDNAACEESPSVLDQARSQATSAWCSAMRNYLNARKAIEEYVESYTAPTYHKLLPDMQPELRGRVKTLVLDLDDLLVHKEWTRQMGWKIFKRPGVQDFLFEMGGYFEVVLFTDEPSSYAEPIINKLDPYRMVLYRLYKPETQYHEGKHVRDLSKLNRDLSQVLMISAHPEAWEFQPENTIKLKPWQPSPSDPPDTTLLDLIPMLQLIATKGVRDTRDVVRSYDGEEDVPKAFKARMSQVSAGQQNKPSKQKSLLGSLAR